MSSPGKSGSSGGGATTPAKAKDVGGGGGGGKAGAGADMSIQPIRILDTPLAQVVRHTHPVLLLSLFVLRFRALVADPVSTMYSSLPALVAVQVAYAVVCLPPAGSQGARPARKPRPGEKKRPGADAGGPNITVTTLVSLVLSAAAAAPLLHGAFVLLGAPLLTHAAHTFLCALHLSLLGVFPLLYARGLPDAKRRAWMAAAAAVAAQPPPPLLLLDEPAGGLVGACAGAWLGAVPIPLDWDRDWQRWPVTVLCGVFAGYALGKVVGGSPVAFGRRLG